MPWCTENKQIREYLLGDCCNLFYFADFAILFFWKDRENAQSSCAGLFIGSHLGFDWPGIWVHVDIASPVHAVSTDCFGFLTDTQQPGFVLIY